MMTKKPTKKRPAKAKKSGTKKAAKKKSAAQKVSRKKPVKKPAKTYEHHPDPYNRSEPYLVNQLDEELKDAWLKIREFAAGLGEQRIYASGRAIMFSKKVCYFFVRPQKKYLETVIFLPYERSEPEFKSIRAVSKTKFAHTFRLVHADQVEGELTAALLEAYQVTPRR